MATKWALDAVYGLSEAYWMLSGQGEARLSQQDDRVASLTSTAGEKIGRLLAARGAMTHRIQRSIALSPTRGLPYGFASLTDWVWAEQSWPIPARRARRARWYVEHVSRRPLWVASDEAEYWFVRNSPIPLLPVTQRASMTGSTKSDRATRSEASRRLRRHVGLKTADCSIVPQAVGLFVGFPADVDGGDDALLVGEREALCVGEGVVGVGRDGDG